jgi:AcrR family transcriptional regulator
VDEDTSEFGVPARVRDVKANKAGPKPKELCDSVAHKVLGSSAASSLQDARALKSAQALRAAFLALLERKQLDQITIREITAEAGVHYATFFRHHPTKEALLDDMAADQIDRLVALTVPVLDAVDSQAAFTALCAYVDEHRRLWTSLLTGGAAATMREELLRLSRNVAAVRAPQRAWLPTELAVICTVSLIFETLAWWLGKPVGAFSVEQVAQILHRLVAAASPQATKT